MFTGSEQVEKYLGVFLTDERTPRKTVLTKKFCDNNPAIARAFDAESERIGALIERRRAVTDPGPHPGAAANRDGSGRELSARKTGTRPAGL